MNKRIIYFTLTLFFLSIFQPLPAVRAYPNPMVVIQPDGTRLTIKLLGDEHHHYRTTTDGFLIKADARGYYNYAIVDSLGNLIPGKVRAQDVGQRSSAEISYLLSLKKAPELTSTSLPQKIKSRTASTASLPQKAYPLSGSPKSIVILVNFADKSFSIASPQAAFTSLLDQSGYSTNGGTGSARDYFMADSYGKFAPNFVVVGPVTLPQTLDYYGKNNASGNDSNPVQMIVDACTAANAQVDFTQFDTDNDGVIDNVFVYYAGYNEAEGGPSNTIWPHRWGVYPKSLFPSGYNYTGSVQSITFDGKRLMDYACTSELRGNSGTNMCGIGTFCHEFGHVLGLPDYYDTSGNQAHTLDYWSIMDAGAYSNLGRTPPLYSAYDRFFLGWLTPQQIKASSRYYLLPSLQTTTAPATTSHQSYLLSADVHNLSGNNPLPSEFFMLEYRKKTGWDSFLPAEGMCVWHIDYNQNLWDLNVPNNYTGTTQTYISHMHVYLVPPTGVGTTPPTSAFTIGNFTPLTWSGVNFYGQINAINHTPDSIGFSMNPAYSISDSLSPFFTTTGTASTLQHVRINGGAFASAMNLYFLNGQNFEIRPWGTTNWMKSLTLNPVADSLNQTIEIRYHPLTAGIHSEKLIFSSTGTPNDSISLSGIAQVAAVTGAPFISAGKIEQTIEFPVTKPGTVQVKTFLLKTTDLLSSISLSLSGTNSSFFSVSTSIIQKDSANNGTIVSISYQPQTTGNHSAILTISGGGLTPDRSINLTGSGGN